jgi:hypothetical protein
LRRRLSRMQGEILSLLPGHKKNIIKLMNPFERRMKNLPIENKLSVSFFRSIRNLEEKGLIINRAGFLTSPLSEARAPVSQHQPR